MGVDTQRPRHDCPFFLNVKYQKEKNPPSFVSLSFFVVFVDFCQIWLNFANFVMLSISSVLPNFVKNTKTERYHFPNARLRHPTSERIPKPSAKSAKTSILYIFRPVTFLTIFVIFCRQFCPILSKVSKPNVFTFLTRERDTLLVKEYSNRAPNQLKRPSCMFFNYLHPFSKVSKTSVLASETIKKTPIQMA